VSSGKTAVAFLALLAAAGSQYQGALMAVSRTGEPQTLRSARVARAGHAVAARLVRTPFVRPNIPSGCPPAQFAVDDLLPFGALHRLRGQQASCGRCIWNGRSLPG
jgi:hypothetical protein